MKEWLKARWPRLRLRTIVFVTLLAVAALPGIAAMFLRVYENTLVRQTEAELIAQGAALASVAEVQWPGARSWPVDPNDLKPQPATIDLRRSPVLPDRPAPAPTNRLANAHAVAAAAALAPVFARTRRITLSSIELLDANGLIAVEGRGTTLSSLPEVRAALAGRPSTVLRRNNAYRAAYRFEWLSRAAALRVHHTQPVVVNGHIVGVLLLSRSARSLYKGIYADRGKIAFGAAAIFVVLVVLSGVLSRGVVRPVEELGRATRSLSSGHGTVPAPPQTAAIEIQGLYADFARMAEDIERRSRYLRDFAHAVSHEFKTPLTGIRGALEIIGDHGETMSRADRARFVANADADARRLQQLTTRLLDLARADMTGPASGTADLGHVLARLADGWSAPGFAVIYADNAHLPSLRIDEGSLDAIVSTLIGNSQQAGATRIMFSAKTAGDWAEITAVDDGPGIPETDRARVFEPFFTTRRETGGSGLGLPIARSLSETAGGSLELIDTPGGCSFRLRVPLAGQPSR